ncbi:uncharacterized protein [Penaeus vannamei]|uniref:uncharacterized protein isoform X2 n=1 Tax=Penaeus vannamei TaxID=6689 RepID=UPI00387F5CDA
MASRFFWILGSLFALFLCLDAAFPACERETIEILKKMESEVRTHHNIPADRQFAVLHLPGRDPSGKDCHRINFNVAGEVNAYCNFAPSFTEITDLKGKEEVTRHSEWQLIHTALRPMLEKWKGEQAGGNANMIRAKRAKNQNKKLNKQIPNKKKVECPKEVYLYTFNAPDHHAQWAKAGYTCTLAIVNKIPEIFEEANCEKPNIVVGFSQVLDQFKENAWKGCASMHSHGVCEYNLENGCVNTLDTCDKVTGYDRKKG